MAGFLILIFAVVLAERWRSSYHARKTKDLWIDLLSFAVLITASNLSRNAIHGWSLLPWSTELARLTAFIDGWPTAVRVTVAILSADFLIYWIHRAFHLPALWRIHVWHHSVSELYWFSGFRASAVHTFLYLVPQLILASVVFRLRFWEYVFVFTVGAFAQLWAHTSFRASPRWLEWFILTPKYHRVHHSRDIHGKNYGAFLTVWDRVFGTHLSPGDLPDDFPVGLDVTPTGVATRARMMVGI